MDIGLTDRQLDIMNILWDRGSATVREAKEELDEELAYTSVLTVFQTLESDGKVRHEREGKAYRYYPAVTREEAAQRALDYVLRRLFGDASGLFADCLANATDLSDDERRDLHRLLGEGEGEAG